MSKACAYTEVENPEAHCMSCTKEFSLLI